MSNDPIKERAELLAVESELRGLKYIIESLIIKIEKIKESSFRKPKGGDFVTSIGTNQNYTSGRIYRIFRADDEWFWIDGDDQRLDRMTLESFNHHFVFITPIPSQDEQL